MGETLIVKPTVAVKRVSFITHTISNISSTINAVEVSKMEQVHGVISQVL